MTFLPIVDRELREASRRHGTYTTRLIVGLAAIVVGLFLYLASVRQPQAVLSHNIFQGLSVIGLLYCLAAGRRFTADCLSEEKRNGTLGLLFLTPLKGYDVVLGKLAATSLNGFFCLLAMFPVLAVPLLLGGVTYGEFWRMILVLVNTFLFSLAIGVFASTLSWNARRAMGANFVWLLLLAGVVPACAGVIAYFTPSHIIIQELLYSCPGYSFYLSSDTVYKATFARFWWSAGVTAGLTWLLVLLASWRVPLSWQDTPSESGKANWRDRWQWLAYGSASRRNALRARLLDVNPYYWLASRVWCKPAGVWAGLTLIACWWLYLRFYLGFTWFDDTLCFTTALMVNSLLKVWVAVETGQRLADDQNIGALELLLSTPLTVRDVLKGQLLALRRQFLWPLVLILLVEVFFIVFAPVQTFQTDWAFRGVGLAMLILLLADLSALVWVAMATGLTAKSANHASVATILQVLMLPWVVFGMIAATTNIWAALFSTNGLGWKFYLGMWFLLGILADLGFGLPAWWRLRTNFRQLALQRSMASEKS